LEIIINRILTLSFSSLSILLELCMLLALQILVILSKLSHLAGGLRLSQGELLFFYKHEKVINIYIGNVRSVV
jgi:hypothetical protein